jgi:hypothetical protein
MSLEASSLRQKVLVFAGGLGFMEGVACFIWLLTIPADTKNTLLWGFSIQRLFILGIIAVGSITCLVISWLFVRREKFLERFFIVLGNSRFLGRVNLLLGSGFLIFLGLLVVPPPGLMSFGSAAHQRLSPLLVLGVLCLLQTIVVIDLLAWPTVKQWGIQAKKQIQSLEPSLLIATVLLLISAVLASFQVYYIYYNSGEEGDTIAVGWLSSKGWVLYKDVFSHHFPFPYFYVALIVKLFGTTILPIRLSLIFLRTLVFGISMKFSRYRLALGITALGWSLVGHLYLGNALIYYSFSGIFVVGCLAIGISFINDEREVTRTGLFMLGLFGGLAIMSDPLMLFPTSAIIIFVMLSLVSKRSRAKKWSHIGSESLAVVAGYGLFFGSYLIYALLTKSLTDFIQNGILFNIVIYSKYTPPFTLGNWLRTLASGLDIGNPLWFANVSPFYQWDSFTSLDYWVFSGFFYHAVILLAASMCLWKRKFLAGVTLYVTASLTMIRSVTLFYAAPFVLVAFFVCAWLISGEAFSSSPSLSRPSQRIGLGAQKTLWLVVVLAFAWLNIRGAGFLLADINRLNYDYYFGRQAHETTIYRTLARHCAGARLLVYPLDPIIYFFAQIPPASKYIYMTPWTAEIGQAEVVKALSDQPTMLFIDRNAEIWGYPIEDYMPDVLRYVDLNFTPAKNGVNVSPLLETCR